MKATIKIIGVNKIFSEFLGQEYRNIEVKSANRAFVFVLNESEQIFVNGNPQVKFIEDEGILLEGYCIIGDRLGNLSILITKLS
jgi:hypothetical protein